MTCSWPSIFWEWPSFKLALRVHPGRSRVRRRHTFIPKVQKMVSGFSGAYIDQTCVASRSSSSACHAPITAAATVSNCTNFSVLTCGQRAHVPSYVFARPCLAMVGMWVRTETDAAFSCCTSFSGAYIDQTCVASRSSSSACHAPITAAATVSNCTNFSVLTCGQRAHVPSYVFARPCLAMVGMWVRTETDAAFSCCTSALLSRLKS